MNISGLIAQCRLAAKVTATNEHGILDSYYAGVAMVDHPFAPDSEVIAVRDITVPTGLTRVMYLDNFELSGEGVAFKDCDGEDIALIDIDALMVTITEETDGDSPYISPTIVNLGNAGTYLLPRLNGLYGTHCMLFPLNHSVDHTATLTLVEQNGLDSGAVVRVIALGNKA